MIFEGFEIVDISQTNRPFGTYPQDYALITYRQYGVLLKPIDRLDRLAEKDIVIIRSVDQ